MAGALLALFLAAPRLLYPVDAPPQVTSTVGTYRIGHHHAGLDLTTDNREGVRALAAMDGEIVRIKRSHVGYGRAVFIRHPGGWTTVYGHLERFAPALEALAEAEEARTKGYAFERALSPPMPVKQGDFLGYVGTSGTDLIHLHFELRSDNIPVDPLTHGLVLPDTQPPVVSRVLLVPRDAGAQIAGRHAPFEFEPTPEKPPIEVAGRVGVLVEITDHIDGSARGLEPARLSFSVDGTQRYGLSYDRVSYGEKNATELDYLAERRADASGRFHRMWREGPDLLVSTGGEQGDLGDLAPGAHVLAFSVADAVGHETKSAIPIAVVPFRVPCAPTEGAPLPADTPTSELEGTQWSEAALVIDVPEACAPDFRFRLGLEGPGAPRPRGLRWTLSSRGPALAVDLDPTRDARLVFETQGGGGPARRRTLDVLSVRPGATVSAAGGAVRLDVGADALFAPYLTDARVGPNPGAPGLEAAGPLFTFRQTWRPVRGPSTLSLAAGPEAAGRGVGIYFREGDRAWRVGARRSGRGAAARLSGSLVHVGPVGLMRDSTPPAIGEAAWEAHPAGARLVLPLSDAGAGIDPDRLKVEVDGTVVWPEYFFAYGRAVWRPWKPLAAGVHRLDVAAVDAAGNRSRRRLEFTIPKERR